MITHMNSKKMPVILLMSLIFTVPVYATEGGVEDGDMALRIVRNVTAFNKTAGKVQAIGKQIEGIFGSVYKMLFTIGVCIAATGMIIAFVEIGLSKKGRLRESAKWKLVGIAAALILIGGATTFVNLFIQLVT